jgi:hypothetical protein
MLVLIMCDQRMAMATEVTVSADMAAAAIA